ncbi:hypothetical protein Btru_032527 [Bulinus truncatus]|nr:hypothetical protein Btru_032527 [Bulinus truncatus]
MDISGHGSCGSTGPTDISGHGSCGSTGPTDISGHDSCGSTGPMDISGHGSCGSTGPTDISGHGSCGSTGPIDISGHGSCGSTGPIDISGHGSCGSTGPIDISGHGSCGSTGPTDISGHGSCGSTGLIDISGHGSCGSTGPTDISGHGSCGSKGPIDISGHGSCGSTGPTDISGHDSCGSTGPMDISGYGSCGSTGQRTLVDMAVVSNELHSERKNPNPIDDTREETERDNKMSQSNKIDLLLIGKTGNGKSSTGNSILNSRLFKTSGSSSSETTVVAKEYTKYKGREITVVDSPGVCDTRLNKAESVKMVTEALNKAIFLNPQGYHALIITIKYGCRFTGEENDTIEYLKQVFGPNFVRDYCIIVMCRGDDFIADNEVTGKTFETWCQEQSGPMKELIDECGGRIVLFNNRTKDSQIKEGQLDKLIELVDNLTAKGQRYTNELFDEAKDTREKIIQDAIESIIKEEQLKETSLIFQKLEKIQDIDEENLATRKLNKLKRRCQKLLQDAKNGYTIGNTIVQDFIGVISSLNRIIDMDIQFYKKLSDGKVEDKSFREEMKKRHKEEINVMKEQLLKQIMTQQEERIQNEKGVFKIDRSNIEECFGETVKELKRQIKQYISIDADKMKTSLDNGASKSKKLQLTDKSLNIEALSFNTKESEKDPTFEYKALKEKIISELTPIIQRQLEERNKITKEPISEKGMLDEKRQIILQEMEQARGQYIQIRTKNTQSFLSRAWAWITRPIRAVVNWIKSKIN